jgi:NAD(P)-dependent dehydrogenase (short-subunit alcohol dehydrogenase family)
MRLSNQVAIVTGAGRNIGEEISKTLASEGAKVAVVDLDGPRGERTAAAIKAAGGAAEPFVADVSKGSDVEALVKAVVARFGRVDILVNNVAISDNKTILEITEADWDRVMSVTLKSQFLMSKHVAQQMLAQGGGGNIVNVGSTSGWQGRRRAIAYSAAKGAIANFTRALAVQLAPHNIRVNAIAPGTTDTAQPRYGASEAELIELARRAIPLGGKMLTPDQIARTAVFLASDDADAITGQVVHVNGGSYMP